MPDLFILKVPVELGLELMTPISTNSIDAKGELLDYIINGVNGVFLIMTFINLQSPDAGGIIYSCTLKTTDFAAFCCLQTEKLDINLDMVTKNLLSIATCEDNSATYVFFGNRLNPWRISVRYTLEQEVLIP